MAGTGARARLFAGRMAAIALALALAGCGGLRLPESGVRAMALADGGVVAQAPEGYCLDRRTSRAETGFAVMGGCALLSRLGVVPPVEGMITVQVGAPGSAAVTGAEEDLVTLLRSARGAQLLSSSGVPESILVEAIDHEPGAVLVRFHDAAPPIARGLERTEWRAFFDVAGRLATLTVRGFERAPMARETGRALLHEAMEALRAANLPQETGEPA
ncbi:MAG: hypothetical protein IT542_06000 [Rubellimicrobium sp.]|nr:hypothetical protein [Rubellimicrobium sp.]